MQPTISNKKKEILIVDDIYENLHLLGHILTTNGLEVSFAESGKQALKQLEESQPQLILLDVSMPVMDGFETANHIKNNPATKDIPIIFITALNDEINIVKGFKAGGYDYIIKPYKQKELLARVLMHLELKEKNDNIKLLNKELNDKNRDLTDSINYANIIQSAFLPSKDKLKSFFSESFIYTRAKDIVSGDFYFFEKIGSKIIIVVADCTGHGVPGSLLSILGISLLNQIVFMDKITDPSEMLKVLDIQFSTMIANTGNIEPLKDGMDVAVCCIEMDSNKLIFCGCKRPLYLIRNETLMKYNGSLHPIGGLHNLTEKSFYNQIINIEKNDYIYLFTDGYADQFSDQHKRKYTIANFQSLLLEIHQHPLEIQQEELEVKLKEWMGESTKEQVDDILVLGIKI